MFLNSSRHQFTFKTITIGLQIKNQSHSLAKYITPFSETKTLLTFPEISRDLSGKTLFPLYKISAEEIRTQKKKREMTEERRKERRAQAPRPRDYEIPVTARARISPSANPERIYFPDYVSPLRDAATTPREKVSATAASASRLRCMNVYIYISMCACGPRGEVYFIRASIARFMRDVLTVTREESLGSVGDKIVC